MIQNFRDNEEDSAIERALDQAYPIFRLFGWTWGDSDQSPTRWRMEQTLRELTDGVLADIENADYEARHATGRFVVRAFKTEDGLTVEYNLELSIGYGE